jgi:hypothetical protein
MISTAEYSIFFFRSFQYRNSFLKKKTKIKIPREKTAVALRMSERVE